MQLTINGTDYELNFGLRFCREISKDKQQSKYGVDLRIGIENAVTNLYTGDVLILPDLVKAATSHLKKKPSDKDIEDFLDTYDDLGGLCDDFLSQLLEQSATKKKATEVYNSLKKEAEKEEKEENEEE